jgi:hypothetical protein
LTAKSIVSGFTKAGLLNDTRVAEVDDDHDNFERSMIEDLENCKLADAPVTADDDIGDGSDSEDEEEV